MFKRTAIFNLILVVVLLCGTGTDSRAAFKDDYDRAYAELKELQNSTERSQIIDVADTFHDLSKRRDAGILLANCYYWEGQCWFLLKEYNRALQVFEKVMTVPNNYKIRDGRFKVAQCYARLKNKKVAEWEFQRFKEEFPNSSHIQILERELNRIP